MTDEKKETVIIDVRKAIDQGIAIRINDDLTIGSAQVETNPIDERMPWERGPRNVKLYEGDPPSYDGRQQVRFRVREVCGFDDQNTKRKCDLPLIAERQVNSVYERDEHGFGGQLQYDTKDFRYYLHCPIHGPFPAGPTFWKDNKKLSKEDGRGKLATRKVSTT